VLTRTSLPAAQQDAADPLQTCCSPADPRASLLGLAGFLNLPATDLATAAPLVLAFSEFDDSPEAWARYDKISFLDLCMKLGVSRRTYDEVFEPMVLTGLFAPGNPNPSPNPDPNPDPNSNPIPNPNPKPHQATSAPPPPPSAWPTSLCSSTRPPST